MKHAYNEIHLILGDWRPGKSGITLTKTEWEQLLALQPKINFN
jgi:Transcriptional Coactivator p15 (PC4)